MPERSRGTVVHINAHGAVVRLADGGLAAVPAAEAATHRAALAKSLREHEELGFLIVRKGKHAAALLCVAPDQASAAPTPQLTDPVFEERMNAYLRSLEEEGTSQYGAFFCKKRS